MWGSSGHTETYITDQQFNTNSLLPTHNITTTTTTNATAYNGAPLRHIDGDGRLSQQAMPF
jgi:hypothetical protein